MKEYESTAKVKGKGEPNVKAHKGGDPGPA